MTTPTDSLDWLSELPLLAPRSPHAHKGDFGRVLIIAGSRGLSGAAILTGMACVRSGAGLVTIATPIDCQPIIASAFPAYMTLPLPQNSQGILDADAVGLLASKWDHFDCIAVGPGLGQGPGVNALITQLFEHAKVPIVFDADALNTLARLPALRDLPELAPRLMTPHPGEAARLLNCSIDAIEADRIAAVRELAGRWHGTVLLKGHHSLISDGRRIYRNLTGNPGMATGGTGDVLTGIIAGMLKTVGDPFLTMSLAAAVHGRAGDIAAEIFGEISLSACDLIHSLPQSFRERIALRSP